MIDTSVMGAQMKPHLRLCWVGGKLRPRAVAPKGKVAVAARSVHGMAVDSSQKRTANAVEFLSGSSTSIARKGAPIAAELPLGTAVHVSQVG